MSILCWLASSTQHDRSNSSKVVNALVTTLMIVMLIVAIYLAVRDMGYLQNSSTKFAILALALFYPDLYILLHWISTSSSGVGFFSGAPVTPLPQSSPASYTPFSAGSLASFPESSSSATPLPAMPNSSAMTPSTAMSSDLGL